MALTTEYIRKIQEHLSSFQLEEKEFLAEMTDHYISAIETQMNKEVSFEAALQLTDTEFGGRMGLIELEESYRQLMGKTVLGLYWNEFKRAITRVSSLLVFLAIGSFFFTVALKSKNPLNINDFMKGFIVGLSLISMVFIIQIGTRTTKGSLTRRLGVKLIFTGILSFMVLIAANNRGFIEYMYSIHALLVPLYYTLILSWYLVTVLTWRRMTKKHAISTDL
ncbi:hypothetical protein QNI16_38435 [Cytophagaceae bacterium YF14B1]|uniref:Uncharacterized protein n=1 Tax=Xanthocytophaga flava TaxID=3048013 RepID=A0AAE3UAQ7_9BACT|nr:hypothetical protein [Xanthocytophaga flavus]MDJ1486419.1 hypothetical protein [Xanthocytophaga flavus]